MVPLTLSGAWRDPADVIAVLSYLAGVVPLVGLALIDLKVIGRDLDPHARMGLHAALVAVFPVVAHVAMIFGRLDPPLMTSQATPMGGMNHSAH